MYCKNLDCHKLVPHDSLFCPYCGGREFSKLKSPSVNGAESDELSMENFQKIMESTEAVKEESVQPTKQKPTLNSRFAVRVNAVGRKLPLPKKQGWLPGQAARKRNIFIGVIVVAVVLFYIF
jgi:DNA-directed RNA polymerase subunit RPC12/RpoP